MKNAPKLVSRYLKGNMQNQTMSELYTDDKKTKYSSNPNDILKSAENFYEKLYTKRQPPKLLLLKFLAKFITETKYQMNNFTFVRLNFLQNFINIFSYELPHISITEKTDPLHF